MSKNDDIRMIERDLEETRARTESTIHALQSKLQPRAVLDEATRFFQGTDSGEYAERITRSGLAQARENPVGLALIAAGVGLLAAKRPGRVSYVNDASAAYDGQYDADYTDTSFLSEADYRRQDEELDRLYGTEWEETHRVIGAAETIDTTYTRLDGEDDDTYQNRLYEARGRAFKVDRHDDEDDHSFRKRIDERLEGARAKRDEYKSKASDFRRRQTERAANLKDRAGDLAHRAGDRSRAAYDGARARGSELAQDGRQAARQGVADALGRSRDQGALARQVEEVRAHPVSPPLRMGVR